MSAHVSSLIHVSFWLPYLDIQTERKDLLQLMLDASQVSPQLEEGHVLINSVEVLMAGHETTSSALTFASYLLALSPKVQDKLAEEVSSYLQENPVSPHQCPNSVEILLVINFSSLLLLLSQSTRPRMKQHRKWSTLTWSSKRHCECTLPEACKCH